MLQDFTCTIEEDANAHMPRLNKSLCERQLQYALFSTQVQEKIGIVIQHEVRKGASNGHFEEVEKLACNNKTLMLLQN